MSRPGLFASLLAGAALLAVPLAPRAQTAAPGASAVRPGSLTDVQGIEVGHAVMAGRPTGCTVVLTRAGAVAGVDVRGAAPGTRETDVLAPTNSVSSVHAIVLSGGSAFGLDSASGVMRYLDAQGVGFRVGQASVPIVPAAVLLDLGVGDASIRPDADCGFRAASGASRSAVPQGSVGAGAGATVGKARGLAHAMKGGLGSASVTLADGTTVAALVAVNAWGDIVDPSTGTLVAGTRTDTGHALADVRTLLRTSTLARPFGGNTTLGIVATNATLTKTEATLIARMAHDGFARTIVPSHTPYDGDTIFTLSTGTRAAPAPDLALIGALAAEVIADAVLNAVRSADSLPGLPSARDLAAAREP